jgi:hypothetical protein
VVVGDARVERRHESTDPKRPVELLRTLVAHAVDRGQGALVPHQLIAVVLLQIGHEVRDHAAVEVVATAPLDLGPHRFQLLPGGRSLAGLPPLHSGGHPGHHVVVHVRLPSLPVRTTVAGTGTERRTPGRSSWTFPAFCLAVAVGFEPTEACTSHAFEACSFGRSDTPPSKRLQAPLSAEERT